MSTRSHLVLVEFEDLDGDTTYDFYGPFSKDNADTHASRLNVLLRELPQDQTGERRVSAQVRELSVLRGQAPLILDEARAFLEGGR